MNMKNNNSEQKNKQIRMTTQPVEKLICSMAVPSIISMLISAFYNMADTFFVGTISTQATGAIGIVFSYMALIQAISFFFGHGGGNFISRSLGKGDNEDAEKMASTAFFSAMFVGIVIAVAGSFFMRPILDFFGATDTIMPEAEKYFRYILIATPFIMGSFVLNNIMRMQGNAKMAVIGISSGAILNVALDPLLIFGFKMGITGAAAATGISQTLSFFLLFFLSNKNGGIRIKWKKYELNWNRISEIFAGGIPSLARQGLASVAAICLNNVAKGYGDSAIAAFSVVSRITMMAASALIGFGQGFQPVCGFNYGAGLYERVRKGFWFCVKVATAFMLLMGILGFAFSSDIVKIFRKDDAELIKIASQTLRFQCITLPLNGFIVISNMYLQNTRKTLRATITAIARQGLIFIPVLYILNTAIGLTGVEMSQAIADGLTFIVAIPLAISGLREMKRQ